ncbi:MAG: MBOAT family protein [Lachnospiraceae bacterium]|nr:MBOAT family protein [Lachnospiraceae bacterium]
MDITSFYFLCFYAVLLLLYYVLPRRLQWPLLLAGSLFIYGAPWHRILLIWPLAACLVTYGAALLIRRTGSSDEKRGLRRAILIADIAVLIGILIGFKYVRYGRAIDVPYGLSFYTFALVGYVVDVYNEIAEPQKNPARVGLYGMYFPLMVSGPVLRFREDAGQFYEPHRFSYENLTFGLQRMLYGFFKKLVIAERAGVIAGAVFNSYTADSDLPYGGAAVWLGILMFTIQLYTDFSGCMDIVLGLSETFGLRLPENFRTPFYAKTIAEYWRRWHITLGVWMKEYVFYPLLRSSLFTKLGKALRAKCGKKAGKQLATFAAMFLLWFLIGLWHGGDVKYVIGSGLLHWFYIVFGEATLPFFTRWNKKLHIPMEGRAADAFRVIRTFILVNIGNTFFRAASAGTAVRILAGGFSSRGKSMLAGEGIGQLGLDRIEWLLLIFSVLVLMVFSFIQHRDELAGLDDTHAIRRRIAALPLIPRWVFWFAALFFVILFGQYGPGYTAAEFIYQGF